MFRRIAKWVTIILGAAIVVLGVGLGLAHIAVRRERVPLPSPATLEAALQSSAGPIRLTWLNTASQAMPRAAVLNERLDPRPADPFVMSHPAFVLEWADGGVLLVDLGMNREQASSFGVPLEWLAGAQPAEPHGSVAERLGARTQDVRGAVFTHLHTDHVGGITDLCHNLKHPIRVGMTPAQAERPNYTTRPGLSLLNEAGCVRIDHLPSDAPVALPGFPGVVVIPAGGHTPGSQIIVASVNGPEGLQSYAFIGDIVNNIDGINADIPKPSMYSLLMVPEDATRLGELRRYLRGLRDSNGFTLLVSHDQRQLEASGIRQWEDRD